MERSALEPQVVASGADTTTGAVVPRVLVRSAVLVAIALGLLVVVLSRAHRADALAPRAPSSSCASADGTPAPPADQTVTSAVDGSAAGASAAGVCAPAPVPAPTAASPSPAPAGDSTGGSSGPPPALVPPGPSPTSPAPPAITSSGTSAATPSGPPPATPPSTASPTVAAPGTSAPPLAGPDPTATSPAAPPSASSSPPPLDTVPPGLAGFALGPVPDPGTGGPTPNGLLTSTDPAGRALFALTRGHTLAARARASLAPPATSTTGRETALASAPGEPTSPSAPSSPSSPAPTGPPSTLLSSASSTVTGAVHDAVAVLPWLALVVALSFVLASERRSRPRSILLPRFVGPG